MQGRDPGKVLSWRQPAFQFSGEGVKGGQGCKVKTNHHAGDTALMCVLPGKQKEALRS